MESFELLNINYVKDNNNNHNNHNSHNNVLQRISQRRLMALIILWICVLSSSMSNEISYNNMIFGANYEKLYTSRINHHSLLKTSCIVRNRTFVHGETFLLDCRTQCVCQNGKYGCSSLCPQEALPPQCHHPQLLEMPGQCCRQWLCDPQQQQQQLEYRRRTSSSSNNNEQQHQPIAANVSTSKDNNTTYYILSTNNNNFNKSNGSATTKAPDGEHFQEDMKYSQRTSTAQWSSCTMSCGTGLSQRQLNTEYETITETRVCQNRECTTGDSTTSTTETSSDVTHETFEKHSTFYHHRRKGHDCRATQHLQTPIHYQIGTCQSIKSYRPKYCAGECILNEQICCKPLLTTTINIKFICDNTEDSTFETDMDLVYDNLQLGINLWNKTTEHQQESLYNNNNNNNNKTRLIHVNVQWILKCICYKCMDDDYEFNSNYGNDNEFITEAPKTEIILHRVHRTAPP